MKRHPLMILNPRNSPRDWYRIANSAGDDGPALVYIYDEIGLWGVTASDFVRDLLSVTASSIELHLNSPGGDVYDGIAIYNAIRNHPATVSVRIDGLAASAASFIAMAGDTVCIEPNAQIMIHDAIGICFGNAAEMTVMAGFLDKASDNIASIYQGKAGGQTRTWRSRMQAETWYSANEAKDAGLADTVGSAPAKNGKPVVPDPTEPDEDDIAATWDLSAFKFAGRHRAPDPEPDPEDDPEPIEVPEVSPAAFVMADVFRSAMNATREAAQ